jgi:zinc finger protein
MSDQAPMKVDGETCPICSKKELTLMESQIEVPYFGKLFVFGMSCSACKYHKADVEAAEAKTGAKYSFEVKTKEDLTVRVVKSSQATIKLPHIGSITPGPESEGYVSNIEGIIERIKGRVETIKNSEDDAALKKKAKNLLKKINKILVGEHPVKVIIEDPTGNSAIISERAVKTAFKGKKK